MSQRVFISSTCYDLIDIRAELESLLREMQLIPVLSDRSSSEFQITPDANSIEICLENVRSADFFVIILSQRYGPSLSVAGYGDISATHLEYLEAKKFNKPIFMYVRDRLDADFALFKRNKGSELRFSWIKTEDKKIFDLLEDHRQLTIEHENANWLWTFRDSCELKQRIKQDFAISAGKAILQNLMERGRIAFIIPCVKRWEIDRKTREIHVELKVTNAGTASAIQPFISFEHKGADTEIHIVDVLIPGQSKIIRETIKLTVAEFKSRNVVIGIECFYTTPEAHTIADESEIKFLWFPGEAAVHEPLSAYKRKRYFHSNGIDLKTAEEE